MSVDVIGGPPPPPPFNPEPPVEAARATDASSQVVGQEPPQAVAAPGVPDTIETLLLSVARGDNEAFVVLQGRIAGLMRVNIRRILRDASRSEAVTQETFAAVLEDAISFDPNLGSAQTWLLTRAHQHAMDALGARAVGELGA